MAYALVNSVTDFNDFLDKLYTFATVTDGNWSGIYNTLVLSSPNVRQIAIEQDNCHVAIGSRTADVGVSKTPSGTDTVISAALSTSLTGGLDQYWSHPGSIVTSATDSDRVRCNDLGEPPFSNVWFFSEDSGVPYIHCVVQSAGERYTHLNFGIIDPAGQTHPNCAFLHAMYHEWWPDGVNSNNPASSQHSVGVLGDADFNMNVRVPASVLPVGYPAAGVYNASSITHVMERGDQPADHWSSQQGSILDFFLAVSNQPVTGGTVMLPLAWNFSETVAGVSHVNLGVMPQMRLANIDDHVPGQEIPAGPDTWVIFPWKRKGLFENASVGGSPLPEANTLGYAFAYKKNV